MKDKMNLIEKAKEIATKAHDGQFRKWLGDGKVPYITHPSYISLRVGMLPNVTDVEIAAAWLHDVVEDTEMDADDLSNELVVFDECNDVVNLVVELTKTSDETWPRIDKLLHEWQRIRKTSYTARRIKLIDRIANVTDINEEAPFDWVEQYLAESKILLKVLGKIHRSLELELYDLIRIKERQYA